MSDGKSKKIKVTVRGSAEVAAVPVTRFVSQPTVSVVNGKLTIVKSLKAA